MGLGPVAHRPADQAVEALRDPPGEQDREPRTDRRYEGHRAEPAGHGERRDGEDHAEGGLRAVLRLRLVDLELDRVAARPAGEAGERVAEEEDERVHVRPVAEERPEEAVEGVRQPAGHERGEPAGDRGEERRDRPEEPPHEVRDREQEPEEHREPVALAVVRDLEADGVGGHRVERHGVGVARRVAVVQEEQVAERLCRVALAVDLRVAQPGRRPGERERGEPGQHGEREAEPAVGDGDALDIAGIAGCTRLPPPAVREGAREHQRGERYEDAQRDRPAALRARRRELRLDHVARLTQESGYRPAAR